MPRNDIRSDIRRIFTATPSVQRLNDTHAIAVALSGGPDSMALLYLLSHETKAGKIYALTVDHGLRPESAAEAQTVSTWVKDWPRVEHRILRWTGRKPENAIMQRARDARYRLMYQWCAVHDIDQLWLGHNRTDQAETFLFRLAKGSGLDGLSAMRTEQSYEGTALTLVRPLLDAPKDDLHAFCLAHDIPHVQDPTNQNMAYARSRLRHALPLLEEEGLSEKRLAVTAHRLGRARDALDHYAALALRGAEITDKKATLNLTALAKAPEEIRLRAIRRAIAQMGSDSYGPRLESLEDRLAHFFADLDNAKRFTLGGLIFSCHRKQGVFTMMREKF